MKYQVELVWNREFHFVSWKAPFCDLDDAINNAKAAEDMGDGACVKKTRVVDADSGRVVWAHGRKVAGDQA